MLRLWLPTLCLVILPGWLRAQGGVDYLRDIKPLLRERCFACHGALKQKAGLRLDTTAAMRKGGETGPALVPGDAGNSLILERISAGRGKRMPPASEGEPLTAGQIALLKRWINQGARAVSNERAEEDPRKHWAFRVPVRPALPAASSAAWNANPVDAFLAAEHDKNGLKRQPEAARPVLLRRVYLDLIGLPPTRAELYAFLNDPAPDAYEKVVERLLASPHYGERWGRHWMDVWRYSDWYGRRAVPDVWNSAPQIWRWRDWIVKSLNADRGYDRMVQEMLAADEIAPEDDETLAATGFIVRNWYALNPNQWMRDLVEHTGKAFLGLTLNCCHCHDHKYDPISQEEYFRFRAFFEPLGLRQDRVAGEGDCGPFQKYEYAVLRKVVKLGTIRAFDEHPEAQTYVYSQGDERLRLSDKPPAMPAPPAFLSGKACIEPITLPPQAFYPGLKSFVQREELATRERAVVDAQAALAKAGRAKPSAGALFLAHAHLAAAEAELKSLQARIAADEARYGSQPRSANALIEAAGKAEKFALLCAAREKLVRAEQAALDCQQKTATAKAGLDQQQKAKLQQQAEAQLANARKALDHARKQAATAASTYTPLSPVYAKTSSGRRAALTRWITSPQNPLTARVAVNHIWMRHFEKPLVETVFDFGRNGKKPSHPQLLDWLAIEFMNSGWSMKHLHRLVVTSRTYRMKSSSETGSPNQQLDPDNHWLWRFPGRRLEAELVRDSLLAVSGELDLQVGGPVLENTEADKSRRRSLYFSVYPEAGGHARMLELFDAPDPCDCYRRSASVVPQQALALTNNELALNQSRLLARRLWAKVASEHTDPKAQQTAYIIAGFEQALSRQPSASEQAMCLAFLERQADLIRKNGRAPAAVPGAIAPSSDPEARARESLARVLFNHPDFVTIR
jgi:hypothetical protein